MAAEPQKPKSRKKQQIEPLDWATMSQSPALKGMVSFLEVTPEDIRRQQGRNGDSRTGSESRTARNAGEVDLVSYVTPGDAHTGSEVYTGFARVQAAVQEPAERQLRVDQPDPLQPQRGVEVWASSETSTGSDTHTGREMRTDRDLDVELSIPLSPESHPREAANVRGSVPTGSESVTGPLVGSWGESTIGSETHTGRDTHTGVGSHIGSGARLKGADDRYPLESSYVEEGFAAASRPRPGQNLGLPADGAATEAAIGTANYGKHTTEDLGVGRVKPAASESHTGGGTRTGSDSLIGTSLDLRSESRIGIGSRLVSESQAGRDALTGGVARTGSGSRIGEAISHAGSETFIGDFARARTLPELGKEDTPVQLDLERGSYADRETHAGNHLQIRSEPRIGSDSHTGRESLPASRLTQQTFSRDSSAELPYPSENRTKVGPVGDSRTGGQVRSTYFVGPDQYSRPQRRMPMLQGDVVWQNRKIRKCILAQDAHSQGEDALFSAMWNAAKPDPADPSGSRTLRIGYAELAQKSRMHRSNIRINIAGLRAKLAIEVLDEHVSRDVMPRLYRLYSYKEILERRKAAGLEYVIRKKSVVFVTETGEVVTLPGLSRPAARKAQRQSTVSDPGEFDDSPAQEHRAEQLDLDVRDISAALSQHWPVDEAAAQQLLRHCRSIRRDAEIGEIVFFINEKLQIALTNRNIKNPTGLILATVPQCFEGAAFQEFRRRRNEALRLAAEEQERKRQQERDLEVWLDEKMRELTAMADDESRPEAVREKARRELKQYGV